MSAAPGDLAAALARRLEDLRRRVEESGAELDRLEVRALAGAGREAVRAAEEAIAGRLGALRAAPGSPAAPVGDLVLRLLRLGTRRGPAAERAAELLAALQAPDGGFGPEGGEASELRLRRTAHLAAWLASGRHGRPSVLGRASAFLLRAWSPARVAGTPWADLAAWAHFFSHAADEEAVEAADAAIAWCGRELERAFRAGRIQPGEAARVLAFCDAVAIPGGAVHAEGVLRALAGAAPAAPGAAAALGEAWAIRRLADLLGLPLRGAGGG